MTQNPEKIDEGSQKPCTDLHLVSHHWSDITWVTPAAFRTNWKPNVWCLPAFIYWSVTLTCSLLSIHTRMGCDMKALLLLGLLWKLTAFPVIALGCSDHAHKGILLGAHLTLSSVKMKRFPKKINLFTHIKTMGNYIEMKYHLIFSTKTTNHQGLEPVHVVRNFLCSSPPSHYKVGLPHHAEKHPTHRELSKQATFLSANLQNNSLFSHFSLFWKFVIIRTLLLPAICSVQQRAGMDIKGSWFHSTSNKKTDHCTSKIK